MPDTSAPAGSTNVGLVLVLWLAGLCAAGQFAKISIIFPELQAIYADAEGWNGFLVSILSFMGILLGLTAGQTVTRFGYRRVLIAALLLGAAMSLWQATLPPFPLMLASRLFEGLSHLGIVVAAPTLIARLSTPAHQPFTMTLWGTFFGVSYAVFALLGAALVSHSGVPALFVAHACAMLLIAAALYFLLPAPVIERRSGEGGLSHLLRLHRDIYRSPRAGAAALGWLFYTFTFVSLLTVLPPFVEPQSRTFVTAAMPVAGIASSLTLGVWLLRHFPAVHIVMAGFVASALFAALLLLFPGQPFLCISLFAALGLVQGASFASIPQLNPAAADQARANGAVAQMGNLGNTLGTPLLLAAFGAGGFALMMGCVVLSQCAGLLLHLLNSARRRQSGHSG